MKHPLSAVFLIICGATCRAGDSAADPLRDARIAPRPGATVPLDLGFRDETGEPVRLRRYFGEKPVVLHLVYFQCPMLCNMTMDGLIQALRAGSVTPGDEFVLLTVSFDPREGPRLAAAKKRASLARTGQPSCAEGWRFLTGDEAAIRRLTDAVGFHYVYDSRKGTYSHPAGLIVLTPEGKVSRYLSGVRYSAGDLRLAVVEASNGKIGTVRDRLLLLCYQYDPTRGRYGFAVITALRAAGVLTVVLIAGAIAVLVRRERIRTGSSGTADPPRSA